jgi:hypothetical protein
LIQYDWLHLHHEDFTGSTEGSFAESRQGSKPTFNKLLRSDWDTPKVSAMKLDVAKKIKAFCAAGGYLFAMCSGAETFDIALAADGVDISESVFDGDEPDPNAQHKLDFSESTLAFENFTLEPGYSRRFSDINTGRPDFSDMKQQWFFQSLSVLRQMGYHSVAP